ncbi:hypothetical protein CLOM_g11843, partial [Closterium sp. NIES-68]
LALPSLHSIFTSPFLLTNPSPSLLAGHLAASESGAAEPVAERGAAAAATAAAALVDPDARESIWSGLGCSRQVTWQQQAKSAAEPVAEVGAAAAAALHSAMRESIWARFGS